MCALALSTGAALADGPSLQIQKAGVGPGMPFDLLWGQDPVFPGYGAYDVVQGDLARLRPLGDYGAALTACTSNDAAGPPLTGLSVPALGGQVFFLVRAQESPSSCGSASWNEGPRQTGNRDLSVPPVPAACPCP
jgi:hypothetical protein